MPPKGGDGTIGVDIRLSLGDQGSSPVACARFVVL
jgi:hypothetical protein